MIIDAKTPSETKVSCSLIGPQETSVKDFYLVTVPQGTTSVTFKNTLRIVDYTMGMNLSLIHILTGGGAMLLLVAVIIPLCAAAAVFGSDDDGEITLSLIHI